MPASAHSGLTFGASAVEAWARLVLERSGLTSQDAGVVARSLLHADSRGISTHGVARIPLYVLRLQRGGIVADARPGIVADSGALCVLDGHGAAGAVTAIAAARLAIERAGSHGTAICLVRGGNDFGAAGYYASVIADAGCVGLAACNSDAAMCAPGATSPVLGTNPLAIAVPGTSLLLDMATSAAAHGKIAQAAAEHRPIPVGWGVDQAGRDTTDPQRVLDGGCVLPAAGPKGFGLAFMIDVLAALSGARTSPFIPSVDAEPQQPQDLGMAFLAIAPPATASRPAFLTSVAALTDAVHASVMTPGLAAMVPGEPEEARRTGLAGLIRLPGHLVADLVTVGQQTGTPFPPQQNPATSVSSEEGS